MLLSFEIHAGLRQVVDRQPHKRNKLRKSEAALISSAGEWANENRATANLKDMY